MTYFEATEIYMRLPFSFEYKDITKASTEDIFNDFFGRYTMDQVTQAVKTLLAHLDDERKNYLKFYNLAQQANKLWKEKNNG